jgi:DNA-binding transcriptional ArsR family regulator
MSNAEDVRNEVLRFLLKHPSAPNNELETAVTKKINRIRERNQNRRIGIQRLHGHLNLMVEQGLVTRERRGKRFFYTATEEGRQRLIGVSNA